MKSIGQLTLNNLFDSKQNIEAGVARFRNLLGNDGWTLMVQILNANIEVVQEQIVDRQPEQTEADMDRLRDKLRLMKEMRDMPQKMITSLTSDETVDPDTDADPYDIPEEIEEEAPKAE